ncbi:methyltransferase domain-containing protein [Synechococcus sp. MIT S9504]|uniref:methyltransferase domain-containing protein n=1 Tax=Synechococcus sp. MIT S9504 TaxID=1801628 RepID=UPI0007BBADE4|nr:methyltransferase domain-containing protein [Synechococcus sp. MIT S9504]KZR84402.1 Trans-aconitate 2-methyltransferase [Synechococcus sp. MIT S9504]
MHNSYSDVNQDLLSRIPQTASRILEIGCGEGLLGLAFKALKPDSISVGVEVVPENAQIASQSLDQVICGDIEDLDLSIPLINGKKYDCIIYDAVLEHLKDPWSVLVRHLDLLADEGTILACIPNVQHWSVLADLLNGNRPLSDQGLFGRTYLSWFTRNTILERFRSLNLFIYELYPRIFDLDQSKEFVSKLLPALNNLELDPQVVHAGMAPLQYVVTAGRLPKIPLFVEGFSTLQPTSMAEVRLAQPLRSLCSCPGVQATVHMNQMQLPSNARHVKRILIWQRPIFRLRQFDFDNIQKLLKSDYILVIDWDDDPDHWPVLAQDNYVSFQMVHAVQVSKPELAEMIKKWNPNVAVFPNMIERLAPLASPGVKSAGSGLRMFFGALNRENDWEPLIEDLNKVLRSDHDFWSVSVVHDRKFYDSLELPDSRKSFVPICPHSSYIEEMSRCDFAFLPLLDNRFNQFKSDLKALEAAANGLAVLASPVVYQASVRPGITGELFNSPGQMVAHLSAWRRNPDLVKEMGFNGRKWVAEERMFAYQVAEREAWYRQLADRQQQLNQELLARVPQLKAPISS